MLEKVFEEIQIDIQWRSNEIKNVKKISENLKNDELKIFLKVIIPLIYSHWEGFIISSLKIVFKYLNNLKLQNHKYSYSFLILAYEQILKSLTDSTKFDKRKNRYKIKSKF